MIRSMTAYGRGEHVAEDGLYIAEIRSVNHRFCDIVLRVPKAIQGLEDEIRTQIMSREKRGRIEVSFQIVRNGNNSEYELELNEPLVKSYMAILQQLGETLGLDPSVKADELCKMKDVITVKPKELDMDQVRSNMQEVLSRAMDSLDAMKLQEGMALAEDIEKRLSLIETDLNQIEERAPAVIEDYKRRLREKIETIRQDTEIDENRILQEVAVFASRCDITEEIVRGRSHLRQFQDYLQNT